MSDLNLRLITTCNPGLLEQTLHKSTEEGLHIKSFDARHNAARDHYEVTLCISDCQRPHRLISQLAMEKEIRELTPLKKGRLV